MKYPDVFQFTILNMVQSSYKTGKYSNISKTNPNNTTQTKSNK